MAVQEKRCWDSSDVTDENMDIDSFFANSWRDDFDDCLNGEDAIGADNRTAGGGGGRSFPER